MKTILTCLAVAAMACFAITPASAFDLPFSLPFGAHNPSAVDHEDVANCTLFGPNTYENNPSCETVFGGVATSLLGNSSGHFTCLPGYHVEFDDHHRICVINVPV